MKQLDALIFPRFLGSIGVLFFHARGGFDCPRFDAWCAQWNLPQALSFFFVLSGFILTLVYPNLETSEKKRRYFRHRFARIWPAHLAALAVLLLILPARLWDPTGHYYWSAAVMNVLLLHSYVPLRGYVYAYNSPSWSLATECFFYLCFPWLIHRWTKNWPFKILLTFGCAAVLITLCNVWDIPGMTNESEGVATDLLVSVSPLARIFEFTLGMTAALVYLRIKDRPISRAIGLSIELVAIAAALASLHYSFVFCNTLAGWTHTGYPGAKWLHESGTCLAFALLIIALALERGVIWRWLSWRPLVYLGNTSYAVYLLHQIFFRWYLIHQADLATISGPLRYAGYTAITVGASALMFSFIEQPCRRWLR